MSTKSKIIISVIVVLVAFAAGFAVSYFIDKVNYTRSIDKLSKLLNDGSNDSKHLYDELERRLNELDGFKRQYDELESSTNNCLRIVEQSGQTIGQLGRTVYQLNESSSSITDTIKRIREGQQRINDYVNVLEGDNRRLKEELGKLQASINIDLN